MATMVGGVRPCLRQLPPIAPSVRWSDQPLNPFTGSLCDVINWPRGWRLLRLSSRGRIGTCGHQPRRQCGMRGEVIIHTNQIVREPNCVCRCNNNTSKKLLQLQQSSPQGQEHKSAYSHTIYSRGRSMSHRNRHRRDRKRTYNG